MTQPKCPDCGAPLFPYKLIGKWELFHANDGDKNQARFDKAWEDLPPKDQVRIIMEQIQPEHWKTDAKA